MAGRAISLTCKEVLNRAVLSPYLFILSAEMLAKAIRKNKKNCWNSGKQQRDQIEPICR